MDEDFIRHWLQFNQVKNFSVNPYCGYITYTPNAQNIIYAGNFIGIYGDQETPMNEIISSLNNSLNPVMKIAYEAYTRTEILFGFIIVLHEFNLPDTINLFHQKEPYLSNLQPPFNSVDPSFQFDIGGHRLDYINQNSSGYIVNTLGRSVKITAHHQGPGDATSFVHYVIQLGATILENNFSRDTPLDLTFNDTYIPFSFIYNADDARDVFLIKIELSPGLHR